MRAISLLLLTIVGFALCSTSLKPSSSDYISIVSFPDTLGAFELFEATIAITNTYQNVFNYSEVTVAGIFESDSVISAVSGFWFQDYDRKQSGPSEILTPKGDPVWRIRFRPIAAGKFSFTANVQDSNGQHFTSPVTFVVTEPQKTTDTRGFIHVAENKRYFVFDSANTSYFAVGENVCWSDRCSTYDYDDWLPNLSKHGGNYARLWLDYMAIFDLESKSSGIGKYDLMAGWRLDYLVHLAEKHDMRLMFCFESFNSLRIKQPYPDWTNNPYNAANGGPLNVPQDFFTQTEARAFFKNRLQYIVARFGHSPHILSWELWNEVDLVEQYIGPDVLAWHKEMASFLHNIDSNNHMVTTSFSFSPGDPLIEDLAEISYTQTHTYGAMDYGEDIWSYGMMKTSMFNKPHYAGEYGISDPTTAAKEDPTGIFLHNGLWAGAISMSTGTAMTWWWDNYIAPLNLYYHFDAIAAWTKDIPYHQYTWSPSIVSQGYVQAMTIVGDGVYGLCWVRNLNNTWALQAHDTPLYPIPAFYYETLAMKIGTYTIEWFDTYNGTAISTKTLPCPDGTLVLPFPSFLRDVAAKFWWTSAEVITATE